MKTVNPVDFAMGLPATVYKWAESLHKAVNGGISLGEPVSKNPQGFYNEFDGGNSNGVLVRVGPSGGTEKYNWTTSNTPIVIQHGLVDSNRQPRQPIGYKIVDTQWGGTGAVPHVYQSATTPPTTSTITVAPNNAAAGHLLYIF